MCLSFSCDTHEYNTHWLGELGDLGTCPLDGSLKSWGVQTLCLSGKTWELGRPSCKVLCWGRVYGENVLFISTCFNVGIFSVSVCRSHSNLASGFLSVEIAPCVSLYSVHPWEEGNSGTSYITNLMASLSSHFIEFIWKTVEYCFLYLSRFSREI